MRLQALNVSKYGGPLLVSAVLLTIAVTASLLFISGGDRSENAAGNPPQAAPGLRFAAADGETMSLSSFRGRVVLLNIWATWCAPCRKEMPALDRLADKLGGSNFEVVALSIDRTGMGPIRSFYDKTGIRNLRMYLDQDSAAMAALGITGVPTTLLIDADGREVQRWVGPVEWDSPEVVELIQSRTSVSADGRSDRARSEPPETAKEQI